MVSFLSAAMPSLHDVIRLASTANEAYAAACSLEERSSDMFYNSYEEWTCERDDLRYLSGKFLTNAFRSMMWHHQSKCITALFSAALARQFVINDYFGRNTDIDVITTIQSMMQTKLIQETIVARLERSADFRLHAAGDTVAIIRGGEAKERGSSYLIKVTNLEAPHDIFIHDVQQRMSTSIKRANTSDSKHKLFLLDSLDYRKLYVGDWVENFSSIGRAESIRFLVFVSHISEIPLEPATHDSQQDESSYINMRMAADVFAGRRVERDNLRKLSRLKTQWHPSICEADVNSSDYEPEVGRVDPSDIDNEKVVRVFSGKGGVPRP